MTDALTAIGAPRPPNMGLTAFICPHCNAHAQQRWFNIHADPRSVTDAPEAPSEARTNRILSSMPADQRQGVKSFLELGSRAFPQLMQSEKYTEFQIPNMYMSRCSVCLQAALWLKNRMISPVRRIDIQANPDLPDSVRELFEEAREILSSSPRGAAALMRLAIEKLCRELGREGSIDAMIGQMVADGLNVRVKQALDIVRVTGNNAVHPGTITSEDDQDTVVTMFQMTNIIADRLITQENAIESAYMAIDEEKRGWIDARDKGAIGKRSALAIEALVANAPKTSGGESE